MDSHKLTNLEIEALSNTYNLADGHARYPLSNSLLANIKSIETLLTQRYGQCEVEDRFLGVFTTLSRQSMPARDRALFCPSASIAIEIIANFLRLTRKSVALIEPTFDSLAGTLKRHKVHLRALSEDELYAAPIPHVLQKFDDDALFLIFPNNPTGRTLTYSQFAEIIEYCMRRKKLLILDVSFRFYANDLQKWDQYALLNDSKIDYMLIEDTGKVWPTHELKVSILSASSTIFNSLAVIYRDIFLSISPVTLDILTLLISKSIEVGLEETVHNLITANREYLRGALKDTFLSPKAMGSISLEWMQINAPISDHELERHLFDMGVSILPGSSFFWDHPELGEKHIRIALAREHDIFVRGINALKEAILFLM